MTATELRTRRPSGKPSWPIVLIAGAEKAGKSWACAAASSSDLIGRTLWLGLGEDDPDEYANVPGADFEIVEHDGTYRGFLRALEAAVAAPRVDDLPNLIVWDSATRGWNLICDMAQDEANARAKRKGKNTDEADISMDLWNVAKQRWAHIMDTLRDHDGPVLITARLDEVTVMSGGKPTTDKVLKVQAEKSLPYDVGAVVEMPERGKVFLKGVRSARLQLAERLQWNQFTVDEFWRKLGLDDTQTAPRTHPQPQRDTTADADVSEPEWVAAGDGLDDALAGVAVATDRDAMRAIWNRHAGNLNASGKAQLNKAMRDRDAELVAAAETDDGAGEGDDSTKAHTAEQAQAPSSPPDNSGKATSTQLKDLSVALDAAGITDRQDVLDWTGATVGRVITSRNDLTKFEAARAVQAAQALAGEAVAS